MEQSSVPPSPARRIFLKVTITLVLFLLATEGVYRLLPAKYFQRQYMYKIYEADEILPFHLKKGAEAVCGSEEFEMKVKINSLGMRDREYSVEKPKGTYRILVLGDSYTFGSGVQADETYAKLLEK